MAPLTEPLGMAMPTNAAVGGRTKAVAHLLAPAGRVGDDLALKESR